MTIILLWILEENKRKVRKIDAIIMKRIKLMFSDCSTECLLCISQLKVA